MQRVAAWASGLANKRESGGGAHENTALRPVQMDATTFFTAVAPAWQGRDFRMACTRHVAQEWRPGPGMV